MSRTVRKNRPDIPSWWPCSRLPIGPRFTASGIFEPSTPMRMSTPWVQYGRKSGGGRWGEPWSGNRAQPALPCPQARRDRVRDGNGSEQLTGVAVLWGGEHLVARARLDHPPALEDDHLR